MSEPVRVKTTEFLDHLKKARQGIEENSFVEQAGHFIFWDNQIFTYNENIGVRIPFQCPVNFSVKARDLFAFLKGVREEEVSISVEGKQVLLRTSASSAGMDIEAGLDGRISKCMADLVVEEESAWSKTPENFYDGLKMCALSVPTKKMFGDSFQQVLSCTYINGSKLYSTDRFRLSCFDLEGDMAPSFLLPNKSISSLGMFSLEEYSVIKSWVHFRGSPSSAIISCRINNGTYPDVSTVFALDPARREFVYPSELKKTVSGLLGFVEDVDIQTKGIDVELSEGKLVLRARKENAWAKKELAVSYTEEPISFRINPDFLLSILDKAESMLIGERSVLFQTPGFSHIIMLHRKTKN